MPHPVRSGKPNRVSPSQYHRGGPGGNPGCCGFCVSVVLSASSSWSGKLSCSSRECRRRSILILCFADPQQWAEMTIMKIATLYLRLCLTPAKKSSIDILSVNLPCPVQDLRMSRTERPPLNIPSGNSPISPDPSPDNVRPDERRTGDTVKDLKTAVSVSPSSSLLPQTS